MNASLQNLKGAAFVRGGKILSDKKLLVLDHELKELEHEEELDKLLLNQLCNEMMEEVMDSGSATMSCLLPRVPDLERRTLVKTAKSCHNERNFVE
jgi:hypothetical protein